MTGTHMQRRGVGAAALAVDMLLGEPPTAFHPTVWFGRWIAVGRARSKCTAPRRSLVQGGALTLGVLALAAIGGAAIDALLASLLSGQLGAHAGTLARGAALKPALSLRPLLDAGRAVEHALRAGRLEEARRLTSWHLVSRDTRTLPASEVAGAAISSLAENLGDSVIGPLLAFRAGGLSAAYAYRALNTADSMLGYRTQDLEWFGKCAARADDVANWIPARLSALLVACAAPLGGGSPERAFSVALSDAGRTPSPNAGWPIAAMAGALDVRLTKRGVYTLHASGRAPGAADIRRARGIVLGAAMLGALTLEAI
jgi:adenosylcobinamide-phosphate synthase